VKGDTSSQANPQYRSPFPNRGRRVVDQFGTVWPSCLSACVAHNLNPTTGYFRARFQRFGWRFADEPPRKPASPPPLSEG
jgi:hypothetical protein